MGAKPRVQAEAKASTAARTTSPHTSEATGQSKLQSTLCFVLSKLLKRSEESIRQDKGHYAAYHWDDGFLEQYGESINWAKGSFKGPKKLDYPFWARADFDASRSIVYDESVDPGVLKTGPLKKLAKSREGHFYLPELAQIVASGHAEIQYPMFYGKIASGDSLLDAATHLFCLHTPPRSDIASEDADVDEHWAKILDAISDADLRHHFSLFFQSAESARSFGATFAGANASTWKDLKQIEPVACWEIGEGQGSFCLAKVLNAKIEDIPKLGPAPVKDAPKWNGGELFETAMNHHSTLDRLDALDTLLDRFDELAEQEQRRVVGALGNPWADEPKRALEVLAKAIAPCLRVNPGFVTMLYFQSGYAADQAGDPHRSIELYSKAIETNPDFLNGIGYYNRACEYGLLGQADEAVDDLANALEKSTDWAARAATSGHMAKVRDDPRFQAILAKHL